MADLDRAVVAAGHVSMAGRCFICSVYAVEPRGSTPKDAMVPMSDENRTQGSDATRLRRSCLAVPGSSERMLAKARGLSADEVVLDLEDAVAPSEKTDATRELVVQALLDRAWLAPTRVVRINAVGTRWCLDDVTYVVSGAGSALHGLVLPKVESARQIHFVAQMLEQLEMKHELSRRIALEIQIESPRGLLRLEELAEASDRIEALIFGPGDYAAAIGAPQLTVGAPERDYPGDQWHYVLSRILTVARAFGLQAIDGPYAAIRDLDGFRTLAVGSRVLGFDGKWAIHPDQIAVCNEFYTPTQEHLDQAIELLASYERAATAARSGATVFDGDMIDEASRKMAELTVSRARAAGGITPSDAVSRCSRNQ
jgi:citrate lyase subunit beta/citryl-CoA lyase